MTENLTYEQLENRVNELKKENKILRQAEEDLRNSEDRLRRLIEYSNDSFIITTYPAGKIIDVNHHTCERLGYTYDELLKKSLADIDPLFIEKNHNMRKTEDFATFETVYRHKDGTTFPVEIKTGFFDSNGHKLALSIVRDTSERKRVEEELGESDERYRTLFEHIGVGTVLIDAETGRWVMFNKKAYEDIGYTRDEFQRLKAEEIVHHKDLERIKKRYQKIIKKGFDVFEIKFIKKNGEVRDFLVSSVHIPIRGKSFIQNISFDVTDFKNSERELLKTRHEMEKRIKERTAELEQANIRLKQEILERERTEDILRLSEDKFSKAFHSSPNLISITTLKEGRFIDVNESFMRINGYSREEVIGRTSNDLELFVNPEDREKMTKISNEDGFVRNYEFEMRIKSGEVRKGSFSAEIINIDDQKYMLSVVDDITEQKRAEAALIESEERYRNLFERSPVATSLTTLDGKLITGNKTMGDMLGYTLYELKRLNLFDLYTNPEDRKTLFNTVNRNGIVMNYPVQLKRKDGEIIDVHLTVSKVSRTGDVELFQTIGIEVTRRVKIEREKERLEAQLNQSRRMDAIATLAGGIAHQFNNSLSTIIGNIELLAMDLTDNESIPRYIKPMKQSVYRMTHLTDQLLAYARGGKYQPKVFLLTDFVRNTIPLLEHSVKPSINFETDLPNDILHVKADLTQMQMVMSAIISNASEAIEERGRIRISCKNLKITDQMLKDYSGLKPGQYVSLSIEDDGKGMDEKIKNRVFEPFFSTKFHGRGLEMAAVYGIIKNHEGWISIESEENKGTRTSIYLPAVEAQVKNKEMPTGRLIKGTEIVLVIEDEETVMDVSKAMLERLGYRVLQARTGDEALYIARQFDGKIDLAILDIMLPDMDGKAIYPLLKDIRPDMKVIVCSGYSSDGPAQEILTAGAHAFIQKPFSINKLSESLREVLGMNIAN